MSRAVAVAVVAISVISIWRLMHVSGVPWTGVTFLSTPGVESGSRDVSSARAEVIPGSPADRAGISNDDRIISVNGIAASDLKSLRELDQTVSFDEAVRYEIAEDQGSRTVDVKPVVRWTSARLLFELLTELAIAFAFLLTGAFLLLKRPDDERSRVFAGLSAAAFLTYAVGNLFPLEGMAGSYSPRLHELRQLFLQTTGVWILVLLFHLSQTFPRERPWISKRPRARRIWIHVLPLLFAGGMYGFSHSVMQVVSILSFTLSTAVLGVLLVATPISLVLSYRESSPEEKLQFRWPLFGTAVAIVGGLVIPGLIGGIPDFLEGYYDASGVDIQSSPAYAAARMEDVLWLNLVEQGFRMMLILIPITFAFGILKYRLLGIDRLIRKTTLYTLATVVVFAVYASLSLVLSTGLIGVFGSGYQNTAGGEAPVSSAGVKVATLVTTLICLPLFYVSRKLVERKLFPRRFRFDEVLAHLSEEGESAENPQSLKNVWDTAFRERLELDAEVLLTKRQDVGGADQEQERILVPVTSEVSIACRCDSDGDHAPLRRFLAEAAQRLVTALNRIELERQKAEIDQARLVQEQLIPDPLPQPPGFAISGAWLPATIVSGDLYDVIRISETRYSFCIGDVVGKGMPAALLMSNLQATVRTLASLALSPAEICQRIHTLVRQNVSLGKFITFFYAELDVVSRELVYASAGHVPPLLVTSEGDLLELYTGGGALGAFRDLRFEEKRIKLEGGEKIVCVTDAVTEARNVAEEYGDEKLKALLQRERHLDAESLRDAVIAEVTQFSGGVLQDDMAVLVVEAL